MMDFDNIHSFLDKICIEGTCKFKWSKTGGDSVYHGCLGVQSLALKIAYIVDWGQDRILSIGNVVKGYQKEDGYFVNLSSDKKTIRAETRQALSALKNYDILPKYGIEFMNSDFGGIGKIKSFLDGLDWSNPWGAGSHLSHIMFFNEFLAREESNQWICNDYLPGLWRGDGWYVGKPDHNVRVNGIMKVLSGFVASGLSISHAEELIDACYPIKDLKTACDIMDVVFCLYYCSRFSNYKRDKVYDTLRYVFSVIESFWKGDGFSFYKDKSQNSYLGHNNVTSGTPESDVHGTILLLWAVSLINDALCMGYNLRIQTT